MSIGYIFYLKHLSPYQLPVRLQLILCRFTSVCVSMHVNVYVRVGARVCELVHCVCACVSWVCVLMLHHISIRSISRLLLLPHWAFLIGFYFLILSCILWAALRLSGPSILRTYRVHHKHYGGRTGSQLGRWRGSCRLHPIYSAGGAIPCAHGFPLCAGQRLSHMFGSCFFIIS